MIKAVHASNIPSDLPRSPLQPGLSGDLAQDRNAFAAFWSQCDELRLRFPSKPSRTAAEATACAAKYNNYCTLSDPITDHVSNLSCVYRKIKPARSDGEVRPRWELMRIAERAENPAYLCLETDVF